MTYKVTVVGAGMAGLLAANMLRSDCAAILEAQSEIPNNHSALLRFRSNVVGDVLGLEFKRVKVMKASQPWQNSVADALSYSFKTNGTYTLRSSVTANGEIEERFIAPPNLIQLMVERLQCDIRTASPFAARVRNDDPIISTMPMPALMKLLGYERKVEFGMQHGVNINASLKGVDAYCTLYVPNPSIGFSRISITGNRLTVEFSGANKENIEERAVRYVVNALDMFGMRAAETFNSDSLEVKEQKYSKILPIDESERKRFIIWASDRHNVYSLGRFATWRPGLLLDDVVHDVRVIQKLINDGHSYDHRRNP